MNFLTIQDGEYTLNLNHLASIEWDVEGESAEACMSSGQEFTCEGEDYHALRQAIGLDKPE